MATNYTFSVSLFDASQNPNELQVWQSGTLTIDSLSPQSVEGVLTLPGVFGPISYAGPISPGGGSGWTRVSGSGQTSEAQISFVITYGVDGFLYVGSYLAGLITIYVPSAQESYLYIFQGFSPQFASGAKSRGSAKAVDKRKPQPRADSGKARAGGKAR